MKKLDLLIHNLCHLCGTGAEIESKIRDVSTISIRHADYSEGSLPAPSLLGPY